MTDVEDPPKPVDKKLLSEKYEAFCDALDRLYIPRNISARLTFMQTWPAAAHYIFSEELITIDTEGGGAPDQKTRLEKYAISQLEEFKTIAFTVEEKSVVKGVLQKDYVDSLIHRLGRDLSLYIYDPRFVDVNFPVAEPVPEENPEENLGEPHAQALPPETPAATPQADNSSPVSSFKAKPDSAQKPAAPVEPKGPISFEDLLKNSEKKKSED